MNSCRFKNTLCISLSLNLVIINGVFTTFALANEPQKAIQNSKKQGNKSAHPSTFGLGQPQDAQFDAAKSAYKLSAEQALNLEILNPQSDWNKTYSIGRAAYIDGDFRRAFNAFKLAMIKAKAQGITDDRLKQTDEAMKSVGGKAFTLNARLGFKPTANNATKIEKVFPGSLAWLAGIKSDDRIISMKETGNVTALSVMRNGRVFSATITDKSKPVVELKPLMASFPSSSLEGSIAAQITDLKLLQKYEGLLNDHDLVLLIDKSGSMSSPVGVSGISKWEWCKEQTKDIYSVAGYFPRGITLVLFDHEYQILRNQSVNEVAGVYQRYQPSGGTDLAHPFWDQLSSYFQQRQRKPLIIAVISDFGTSGMQVREGVLEASKRVASAQELVICLLEVGQGGRRLVAALDNEMTSVGAPFDIVDATTTEDLMQIGLKNALVAALMKRQKPVASKTKKK